MESKDTRRRVIEQRFSDWPRRTMASYFDVMSEQYETDR